MVSGFRDFELESRVALRFRMFLHPIDVSLAESFNLVSNVWHVEIVIGRSALLVACRSRKGRRIYLRLEIEQDG